MNNEQITLIKNAITELDKIERSDLTNYESVALSNIYEILEKLLNVGGLTK